MALNNFSAYAGSLFWFSISFIFIQTKQSCFTLADTETGNNTCPNSHKIPLYIGGMMSITVGWDGTGCLVAAEFALDQINNRQDMLPEHELIMLWNDTQCANDKPLRALYDQIVVSEHTKVAILGPSCSPGVDLLAATSQYWNLLTILFAAYSPALSDRSKYPTVYRTVPIGTNVFNDPYIWFIRKYGWSRVGFLSKSAVSFSLIQDNFVEKASKINVSVVTELIQDSAKNQIEHLKSLDMRIIFFYTFEHDTRLIFCEAYKIALNVQNIVWIMPSWFQDKWWLIDDEKIDCTVEELAEIVESSLIIGVDVQAISLLNKTTVAGITPAEYLEEVTKRLTRPQYINYKLNNYMAYTYDAVWAIALMLNSTATILKQSNSSKHLEDFTYTDTDMYNLFFQEMAATDFFGASGHVNFVKGERLGTSEISQLRGQCKMGWILHKRHCYKFSAKDVLDWSMASESCAHEGAHLADVKTESDLQDLRELRSSVVNNTVFRWYVGYHSVAPETNSRTRSPTMDMQDESSDEDFAGSGTQGQSNLCPYVDFTDSLQPLKRGYCREERPFICKEKADFRFLPVAIYESISDEMIWNDEIRWLDGKVPLDGPVHIETIKEIIEVALPGYIHIVLLTLVVIGLVMVLVNTLFIIWFSKRSVFRRPHPGLNYIILLSGILLYSSSVLTKSQLLPSLTDERFTTLCTIRDIIASIGFTLGTSTLVGKLWFVYQTTALKSSQNVFSEVRLIYPVIAFFVCIDTVALAIRHLCYPLSTRIIALGEEVDPSNPHIIREFNVKTCTSSGDAILPWFLAVVNKFILLLLGLFLSFEIRKVRSLGDIRKVTISIYTIAIFGACRTILVILLENDPINSFLFSSVLAICCTTIVLLLMILPKVISAIRFSDNDSWQNGTSNLNVVPSSSRMALTEVRKPRGSLHGTDFNLCGAVPKELLEENAQLKDQLRKLLEIMQRRKHFESVEILPPSEMK